MSNLRLPWNNRVCSEIFHCIEYFFIMQDFWATLRLPWKTDLPKNFLLCWIYFLHSRFLSNLRLPWKTELPWKFSLYWIFFYHSGFLSNLRLPWKTELPWKFSSPGAWPPPPRPPASYVYVSSVTAVTRHFKISSIPANAMLSKHIIFKSNMTTCGIGKETNCQRRLE